jgi:hypothetical protein
LSGTKALIDQPLDPVRQTIGDARDDHAAIAVAHQPDVTQSPGLDIVGDRRNGFFKPDLAAVVAGVVSGNGRAMHLMPVFAQMLRDCFHFGAGMPRAVNQHI